MSKPISGFGGFNVARKKTAFGVGVDKELAVRRENAGRSTQVSISAQRSWMITYASVGIAMVSIIVDSSSSKWMVHLLLEAVSSPHLV